MMSELQIGDRVQTGMTTKIWCLKVYKNNQI